MALSPPLLQPLTVKLSPWPKTVSAVVFVVRGLLYSSTRLLKESAIYTFRELSTATPDGVHRPLAPIPPRLQVFVLNRPPWPKT